MLSRTGHRMTSTADTIKVGVLCLYERGFRIRATASAVSQIEGSISLTWLVLSLPFVLISFFHVAVLFNFPVSYLDLKTLLVSESRHGPESVLVCFFPGVCSNQTSQRQAEPAAYEFSLCVFISVSCGAWRSNPQLNSDRCVCESGP